MKRLALLAAKLSQSVLKRLGRGTAMPGQIALKIDPHILGKIERPEKVICVTGTAGKTSISKYLAEIYRDAGYTVGDNLKGSNLTPGVTSVFMENTSFSGKSKTDVLVIEVDERYVKHVFKEITPDYLLINNLTYDQGPRNGDADFVWGDIHKALTDSIHLILNADDPLVRKFGLDHNGPVTYFGLGKNPYSHKQPISRIDMAYCPVCHAKLEYEYYQFADSGVYKCPNNDYGRPEPDYEASWDGGCSFSVDGHEVKLDNDAMVNVYNLTACYALAAADGLDRDTISEGMNKAAHLVTRMGSFNYKGATGYLVAAKNETPSSYDQAFEFISRHNEKEKTVIIATDIVSTQHTLNELSCFWDMNMELLKDPTIKKIICMGPGR